jgi:hypothetical protein
MAFALHKTVQRLLLIGVRLEPIQVTPTPRPPQALQPLVDAIAPIHDRFDQRAIEYGHRYRSGYWAIYLMSALAVLFAVLPLALGWDGALHRLHPYAGAWVGAEVLVILLVSIVYWRGNRGDWQGEWLRARSTAELCAYLPLLAPLVDFESPTEEPDWYRRVFASVRELPSTEEIARLCAQNEAAARGLLRKAWSEPGFVAGYAAWAIDILAGQRAYHRNLAIRQHATLRRAHALNASLFGLTAVGALLHLTLHARWLAIVTTFFPALGASIHGGMAQSESHRLATTSERLVEELELVIERIESAASIPMSETRDRHPLPGAVKDAISLLLEEHHDWNLVVRPHRLSLA